MREKIVWLLGSILALGSVSASATTVAVQYQTSYNTTITSLADVTNIMMFESSAASGGLTWAFGAAGNAQSLITNPFPHDPAPTSSLLVGLQTDASQTQHAVIFMDATVAAQAVGSTWESVFTSTDESAFIQAIVDATSGLPFGTPSLEAGLSAVFAFGDAAKNTPLGSAWFATGGDFTVMAWSSGEKIGYGTSTIAPLPVTTVPLPAAAWLFGSGLAALGVFGRRREHA